MHATLRYVLRDQEPMGLGRIHLAPFGLQQSDGQSHRPVLQLVVALPEVLRFLQKPEIIFIFSPNCEQQTYKTIIENNSDVKCICKKSLDDIENIVFKKNKKKLSTQLLMTFLAPKN